VNANEIRTHLRELRREVAKLPFVSPDPDPATAARCKACAITKIDEALLWLAAYECGGS
jgi:hypothetical protein